MSSASLLTSSKLRVRKSDIAIETKSAWGEGLALQLRQRRWLALDEHTDGAGIDQDVHGDEDEPYKILQRSDRKPQKCQGERRLAHGAGHQVQCSGDTAPFGNRLKTGLGDVIGVSSVAQGNDPGAQRASG